MSSVFCEDSMTMEELNDGFHIFEPTEFITGVNQDLPPISSSPIPHLETLEFFDNGASISYTELDLIDDENLFGYQDNMDFDVF